MDYQRLLYGRPVFALGTFGIPVFHGVPTTLLVLLFGFNQYTLHFYSALCAALTVLPGYVLGRLVANRAVAVLFTLQIVCMPYHIFYSRIISGGRIIFMTAMATALALSAHFFWKQSERNRALFSSALAGIFAAAALYDYFAVQAFPFFFLLLLAIGLLYSNSLRESAMLYLPGICTGALLSLPLLFQYFDTASELTGRMKEQGTYALFFEQDISFFFDQLRRVLAMFNLLQPEGRAAWFSLPILPLLGFPLAVLYGLMVPAAAGQLFLDRRARLFPLLLISALAVSLLPTFLSSGTPDSHRAILSILAVSFLVALASAAACYVGSALLQHWFPETRPKWFLFAAGILFAGNVLVRLPAVSSDPIFRTNFDAQWHSRIQTMREVLSNSKQLTDIAKDSYQALKLVTDYNVFLGLQHEFSGLQGVRWSAPLAFPSPERTTKLYVTSHVLNPLSDALASLFEKDLTVKAVPRTPGDTLWVLEDSTEDSVRCRSDLTKCFVSPSEFRGELVLPDSKLFEPVSLAGLIDNKTKAKPENLSIEVEPQKPLSSSLLYHVAIRCNRCFAKSEMLPRLVLNSSAGPIELQNLLIPAAMPVITATMTFQDSEDVAIAQSPLITAFGSRFIVGDHALFRQAEEKHLKPQAAKWSIERNAGAAPQARWEIATQGMQPIIRIDGIQVIFPVPSEAPLRTSLRLPADGRTTFEYPVLSPDSSMLVWPSPNPFTETSQAIGAPKD